MACVAHQEVATAVQAVVVRVVSAGGECPVVAVAPVVTAAIAWVAVIVCHAAAAIVHLPHGVAEVWVV